MRQLTETRSFRGFQQIKQRLRNFRHDIGKPVSIRYDYLFMCLIPENNQGIQMIQHIQDKV